MGAGAGSLIKNKEQQVVVVASTASGNATIDASSNATTASTDASTTKRKTTTQQSILDQKKLRRLMEQNIFEVADEHEALMRSNTMNSNYEQMLSPLLLNSIQKQNQCRHSSK